ncbi:hypothetical protein [Psittacicella gerlachiana]|uniref:Uncharacterized protein n=1 Tax=Psittacicella gerlachiana TaxID=2028574 RepID=A0A3A1YJP3_9GAMM|nr:hypothetical protein [Psittacicella gerlachiana]RIY37885.1 hypothetical protein CKF59_01250 [Psittacicella gerlachiana]
MDFTRNIFASRRLSLAKLGRGIIIIAILSITTLLLSWFLVPLKILGNLGLKPGLSNLISFDNLSSEVLVGSLITIFYYSFVFILFIVLGKLFPSIERSSVIKKILIYFGLSFVCSYLVTWQLLPQPISAWWLGLIVTSAYASIGTVFLFILSLYLQRFFITCRSQFLSWGRNLLVILSFIFVYTVMLVHNYADAEDFITLSSLLFSKQALPYFIVTASTFMVYQILVRVFLMPRPRRLNFYE